MRKRNGDNGDSNPPPPKPVVIPPDIVFQIGVCLDKDTESKLTQSLQQKLASATVTDQGSGQTVKPFPNPVVLPLCIKGSERIGIWRQAPGTPSIMQKALEQVDLLGGQGGPVFALFVSQPFLDFVARQVFSVMPKRLDQNGPNPNGDITLSDMFVTTEGPSNVITHIKGSVSRPFHNIGFEHTVTDKLGNTNDGRLKADSSQDTSSDGGDIAADILLGILSGGLGGFPFGFAALVMELDYLVRQAFGGSSGGQSGIGAGIIGLAPRTFFRSQAPKLITFNYDQPSADGSGVLATGSPTFRDPKPAVVISPDTASVLVDKRPTTVTIPFGFTTQDVSSPVKIVWGSSDGNVLSQLDPDQSALLRFSIGPKEPLDAITRHVSVAVTDDVGNFAMADQNVAIVIDFKDKPIHKPGGTNSKLVGVND